MIQTNTKEHKVVSAENNLDQYFLTNSPQSHANYKAAVQAAQTALLEKFASLSQPYSGTPVAQLRREIQAQATLNGGVTLPDAIKQAGDQIIANLININHPHTMAHLHCPPLLTSIAADMIISATNQSMDSWDQSAAATLVEQQVVDYFCERVGFGKSADGIFTSGGTQSNFMGMLLARNYAAYHHFDWSISERGIPPEGHKFRILCSADGHFSIQQSARLLGLGDQAIVCVPTDEQHRLQPDAVRQCASQLREQGLIPIALVSTAGTTDFGTISPLAELGAVAKAFGMWFHIDAAFASGLLFSQQHCHRLDGIDYADSLTIDFHKLFYQSIGCGMFLLKDRTRFDLMKLNADYLNPESNAEQGLPDLVAKSVATTRRFDAFKVYLTLQAYGPAVLGQIVDATMTLAQQVAQLIDASSDFELAVRPMINSVVFRYVPNTPVSAAACDAINDNIRLTLLQSGEAVIGFTKLDGRSYLKFTLMNPLTQLSDIQGLLARFRAVAQHT